jgi:hypothetical protein
MDLSRYSLCRSGPDLADLTSLAPADIQGEARSVAVPLPTQPRPNQPGFFLDHSSHDPITFCFQHLDASLGGLGALCQ